MFGGDHDPHDPLWIHHCACLIIRVVEVRVRAHKDTRVPKLPVHLRCKNFFEIFFLQYHRAISTCAIRFLCYFCIALSSADMIRVIYR